MWSSSCQPHLQCFAGPGLPTYLSPKPTFCSNREISVYSLLWVGCVGRGGGGGWLVYPVLQLSAIICTKLFDHVIKILIWLQRKAFWEGFPILLDLTNLQSYNVIFPTKTRRKLMSVPYVGFYWWLIFQLYRYLIHDYAIFVIFT